MIGLGKLAKAILGSGPLLNDLECVPDSPESLNVFLQPGEIYMLEDIDTTAYGPIPSDTTHQIVKQGILLDAQQFLITPPSTPGDSINYLIQITYSDSDTNIENRPFFNQPAQNISTVRSGILTANLKAGTAAPTGTQTTPSPDAGFVGAWVITVANGQTQITGVDIAEYHNAPFISEKLGDKISEAQADLRYAQITQVQASAYFYAQDTGGVNSLVASLIPNINTLFQGMQIRIKIDNTNTGASTLNLNSIGATPIKDIFGEDLRAGYLIAGEISIFSYNGTNFVLENIPKIAIVSSVRMSADQIINVGAKVDFDTVEFDDFGYWDGTNKRFNLYSSGYYSVNCLVYATTVSGNTDAVLDVHLSGVLFKRLSEVSSGGAIFSIGGTVKIKSSGTDFIEVFANSSPSVTLDGTDAFASYFQIEYIGA
jgi:hypothetical protein